MAHEKKSKTDSFSVRPDLNNNISTPPKTSAYSSYAADLILAKIIQTAKAKENQELEAKTNEVSSPVNDHTTRTRII